MANYFYIDDQKSILKEELLTSKARDWARQFITPRETRRGGRPPKLNSSQLRRFYGDAKSLEARVNAQGFDRLKPLVKMMKSKVAYSCPTDGRECKVPVEFRNYVEEMINSIDDERDFRGFLLCFEAVVGFFYGEGGR